MWAGGKSQCLLDQMRLDKMRLIISVKWVDAEADNMLRYKQRHQIKQLKLKKILNSGKTWRQSPVCSKRGNKVWALFKDDRSERTHVLTGWLCAAGVPARVLGLQDIQQQLLDVTGRQLVDVLWGHVPSPNFQFMFHGLDDPPESTRRAHTQTCSFSTGDRLLQRWAN